VKNFALAIFIGLDYPILREVKMRKADELENGAVMTLARLMAAAARTAPKTRGIDNIEVIAIDDKATKKRVIAKMFRIAKRDRLPTLERDANSIKNSPIILLIGARSNPAGLNCGFCGYETCEVLAKTKGACVYNSIDLGIACASAISIASQFHIDNRVMYSIAKACLELGLLDKKVKLALGIPLSVSGKNPFFDRE